MAEKKKILFIVEAMGGGVFTYIVDLANELVNVFDMYIAYAVRKQTPADFMNYFDKRIHLIEVRNFKRAISLPKDIRAFFEIRDISKNVQPDVIHLHSSKAGALGRWAFNGKKIPLFYTPHGYSYLMQNHSIVKRTIYKIVETICGRRNCITISCSAGEHQESQKFTRNATYVDNGIDINELQKLIDSTVISKERPSIVFTLGRICYQKNPALFNQIALAMPNEKFLWIGDGELRKELTAPNIEVTGWTERGEALKYLLQGDVFLLTSLWEGLPIALLESMYMKKPCVVSNVIGNRDVIKNGVNGFVCDDVSEFVDAIKSVDAHKEYIDRAYNDVVEKYNTRVMADKYSKIYMNIISGEMV
ncbi:glycosyltransferase [uncultured Acetatifactor sp.]|jgi:glycosyltransferase involved in cell wall biosynthesis|uniref:glycosyltransferase n=1 Tax=uncultured Acetatifactor sp. TaxID=1671927 RepID=UPI0026398080|nr:glycosyltransferase [uncultured Acetatifactor sp.]